jgi:hypothetical protein
MGSPIVRGVAALADSQTGVLPRTRAVCCSAIKGTWSPSPVADPQKSGLNTSVRTCLVQISVPLRLIRCH